MIFVCLSCTLNLFFTGKHRKANLVVAPENKTITDVSNSIATSRPSRSCPSIYSKRSPNEKKTSHEVEPVKELPDDEASWEDDADDSDMNANGDDADAAKNDDDGEEGDDEEEEVDDSSDDILTKKRKRKNDDDYDDAEPKKSGKKEEKLKAVKKVVSLRGEDVDNPFSVKVSASPLRLF